MRVLYIEGVATHSGPESCVVLNDSQVDHDGAVCRRGA